MLRLLFWMCRLGYVASYVTVVTSLLVHNRLLFGEGFWRQGCSAALRQEAGPGSCAHSNILSSQNCSRLQLLLSFFSDYPNVLLRYSSERNSLTFLDMLLFTSLWEKDDISLMWSLPGLTMWGNHSAPAKEIAPELNNIPVKHFSFITCW